MKVRGRIFKRIEIRVREKTNPVVAVTHTQEVITTAKARRIV